MHTKELILKAARLVRTTKTIEQHERILLNNAARDQLLGTLANSPVPNKALLKLAKKHAIK